MITWPHGMHTALFSAAMQILHSSSSSSSKPDAELLPLGTRVEGWEGLLKPRGMVGAAHAAVEEVGGGWNCCGEEGGA